jgi:hypothetical protein
VNNRDRFRAVMHCEKVDRLPRFEWATWWDQTIARWQGEGLPGHLPTGEAGVVAVMEFFGLDPVWQHWFRPRADSFPKLAHGYGPVEDLASYEAIWEHLYPEIDWDSAFPPDVRRRHEHGDLAVWFTLDGFFWFARSLLGIQRHFFAFYDQPELLKRINDDLLAYDKKIILGISNVIEPEFMTFGEDMSYNNGPMLSRATYDEFMAPYYCELTPLLKARGITPIVDSDGNIEACIPWFAGCGVEGMLPFERQSGVDIARIRQRHPGLRMIGAFDKMTMTHGTEAMRTEWERLLPVMRQGGFIPSVDHQTPPGVSMAQYRDYLGLMWEYTESAAVKLRPAP